MSIWQRLLSLFASTRDDRAPRQFEVLDFRTADDARIAEEANHPTVPQSIDKIVNQLLEIEEAHGLLLHPTDRAQCPSCSEYREPRHDLDLKDGVLTCSDCTRSRRLVDYLVRPACYHLVHKDVVAIGEAVNTRGGMRLMKQVVARWMVRAPAGEFRVRQGCKSNLSIAWHGIGDWQH